MKWSKKKPKEIAETKKNEFTQRHRCGNKSHYIKSSRLLAVKCFDCGKLGHIIIDCHNERKVS